MSTEHAAAVGAPIVLHFGPALGRLSDAEFYDFCQLNRDWRIERTRDGDLIIMPPAGGDTGWRNSDLTGQLWAWSVKDRTGISFDSSTGFHLPNGAERSPDAAWMRRERWDALTPEDRETFPPLVPDFVVELRSTYDSPKKLRAKMQEYIECGARLGWLIDPVRRRVLVFRPGKEPETLHNPASVRGDPELPGFVFELRAIFS